MLSPEVDDNDQVSLEILSHMHIELINERATMASLGHVHDLEKDRLICITNILRSDEVQATGGTDRNKI